MTKTLDKLITRGKEKYKKEEFYTHLQMSKQKNRINTTQIMSKIYPAIAFLCLSLQIGAQNVVWYNKGQVASSGTDKSKTSIYIGGDMKFSNGGSTNAPLMIIDNSRVQLMGNLLNDVTIGNNGGTLFGSTSSTSAGVFAFSGTVAQAITTSGTSNADIPSKTVNYVNFPNLEINNSNHVTINPRLAVKTLDVKLVKGWLIVDSDIANPAKDGLTANAAQESVLSHLLVDGTVTYQNRLATNINERGFIQVNLKIPAEANSNPQKSIVGFGSPFNRIYSDYFMFNTLLAPTPEKFLGNGPIVNPETPLMAGRGYVVGIDLRGSDVENYPNLPAYPNIDFDKRATNGYFFNRSLYHQNTPENEVFGTNLASPAYADETLNTNDVIFALQEGWNYLSNPFTSPLSISKLLGNNQAGSTWDVNSNNLDGADVWNNVWVLEPNSMAEEVSGNTARSLYTYNYQVAMSTGGTYENGTNAGGVIALAPLQMFVLWKTHNTPKNITIPKSERVMGTTRFLRNEPLQNKRTDDFIIEFRDTETKTTDRLSFVLRPDTELSAYSNVDRMESSTSQRAAILGDDFAQSHASQIYTKDGAGSKLTVQFLPIETTKRIQIYHIPSVQAQQIQIFGLRLDTKDKVQQMWLEDKKYNTKVEITQETIYETYCEPTDSRTRFAILISNDETGIENPEEATSPVYVYAKGGSIFVQGFADQDFGSIASLYDLNGRLLTQKSVDSESLLLSENCTSGVYLIKLSGKLNKTIKLVVQ